MLCFRKEFLLQQAKVIVCHALSESSMKQCKRCSNIDKDEAGSWFVVLMLLLLQTSLMFPPYVSYADHCNWLKFRLTVMVKCYTDAEGEVTVVCSQSSR
jgi:hypothetical protein